MENDGDYQNNLKVFGELGDQFFWTHKLLWRSYKDCGFGRNEEQGWCYWPYWNNNYDYRWVSVFLHWMTSYTSYEDICMKKFPEASALDIQKCTIAY